jgi:hypothetical protein
LDYGFREEDHIHTAKILDAIEKMADLLTLPTKLLSHTPFTISIIGTITIAHLSIYRFILGGKQLQIAKERIRVAIEALAAFAKVWPRGERVLKEVESTVQDFLSLSPDTRSTEPSRDMMRYTKQPCVDTGLQILDERSTTPETDYLGSVDNICFDDEYLNANFQSLNGFEHFQGQGGQSFGF